MEAHGEVTDLLHAWSAGDGAALDSLIPLVYDDMRRIARRHMAREGRAVTLQPTVLVHEAYFRLSRQDRAAWQDRSHFLAVAALTIRRVLVERARKRAALKRGGGAMAVTWSAAVDSAAEPAVDLVALDDALDELAEVAPRQVRVVELRFFGGLTIDQTARALGISPATVKLDWQTARAWLFDALRGADRGGAS
jgi:RNA polymerase sigma factor (TIGR02999 family)